MKQNNCSKFLEKLPKTELHMHIEGALEPKQFLFFAKRNNLNLPISDILTKKLDSYRFSDFNSFINTYAQVTKSLCTELDFYELTVAYLAKVNQQGVKHVEIFFELQTYILRQMDPDIVVYGIYKGLQEGERLYGITSVMILCLMRDFTAKNALEIFDLAQERYQKIVLGVGLASTEKDNPVVKFVDVYKKAKNAGLFCVAHISEQEGPEMIWQALQGIALDRIDHGIGAAQDSHLMNELARRRIPLTICPISNVTLKASRSLVKHPIRRMFDHGVIVTINSDDPAFFKSYVGDNYRALRDNNVFSCAQLIKCARNSIEASFASHARKIEINELLNDYIKNHSCAK